MFEALLSKSGGSRKWHVVQLLINPHIDSSTLKLPGRVQHLVRKLFKLENLS